MEYDKEHELPRDSLPYILKALPDNMGLFLEKDGDKMIFTKVQPSDLKKLGEDQNLFHVVAMMNRPWVGYYTNWLEYKHFPPETPANAEFQFRIFKWHGLIWTICSIPVEKKQLCYDAAEISHLRLADGIPIMAGGESVVTVVAATRKTDGLEGFECFPLSTNNTFTLEQQRGDILYEPGGAQDSRVSEQFEINRLWKEHEQEDDPWSKNEND